MQRKKGRKQWQESTYLETHDRIKKALIEANGMTKTEIYKATGLSRVTIDKHLRLLENVTKEAVKIGNLYHWGDKYRVLVKGLEADALLVESLESACQSFKSIISKMSLPKNLWRFSREGAFYLSEEARKRGITDPRTGVGVTILTEEEVKELLEHKEKVFGGLRRCFFELARVFMKMEFGIYTVKDDLSNVEVRFEEGRAVGTVYPKNWRYTPSGWRFVEN